MIRDMDNYFTLMGLAPQFALSLSDLEKRYIALQREHHPDRAVGKSTEERTKAIELSMRVNDAYDTLKSPLSRAEYLLELQGIFVNSESDSVKPSPELLMETMELREQLAEIDDGRSLKTAMDDIKASMARCITELEGAFTTSHYDRAAQLTMRLKYLGKALEEAHMLFYRFKVESQSSHDTH
jgi:molecular chaperone HscB